MTDGIGHREHRKPEGKRDANEADPQLWKASGQDGGAASAQHQPEGSKKLRRSTFAHTTPPFLIAIWSSKAKRTGPKQGITILQRLQSAPLAHRVPTAPASTLIRTVARCRNRYQTIDFPIRGAGNVSLLRGQIAPSRQPYAHFA